MDDVDHLGSVGDPTLYRVLLLAGESPCADERVGVRDRCGWSEDPQTEPLVRPSSRLQQVVRISAARYQLKALSVGSRRLPELPGEQVPLIPDSESLEDPLDRVLQSLVPGRRLAVGSGSGSESGPQVPVVVAWSWERILQKRK